MIFLWSASDFRVFSNTLRCRRGIFVYQNHPKIVFLIKLVLTKYKQGSCKSESYEKVYSSPETSDRVPANRKSRFSRFFDENPMIFLWSASDFRGFFEYVTVPSRKICVSESSQNCFPDKTSFN